MQRDRAITPATKWWILAGLILARIAFGYQFQSVASVAPGLIDGLGLDAVGLGTAIGMFMLPGIVMALPGGLLGLRLGEFPVLIFSLIAMVAGGAISALAQGEEMLWLGRIIGGIGAVLLNVLMSKVVIDWFIDKSLATAMSLYLAGYPAGIALALVTLGSFADAAAWPIAFWISTGLAVIALIFFAITYRQVETGTDPSMALSRPSGGEICMVALAGSIWGIYNIAFLIMLSFVPLYLVGRGLAPAWATGVLGIGTWVTLLAMPLGGMIADRWNRPNHLLVTGMVIWGGAMLLIPFIATSPWLLAVLFAVTSFAASLPVGIMVSLVAVVIRPELRGLGMGIFYTCFYIAATIGPILGGEVLERTGIPEAPIYLITAMTALSIGVFALFRFLQAKGFPAAVKT
ncbi:MAG: MFS transporter [Alphaproteobacteria bacterium]|nr:MFS transporter [Alphaproteobacteria bacterium]